MLFYNSIASKFPEKGMSSACLSGCCGGVLFPGSDHLVIQTPNGRVQKKETKTQQKPVFCRRRRVVEDFATSGVGRRSFWGSNEDVQTDKSPSNEWRVEHRG